MLHADPSAGAFQLREEAVDHATLTSLVVEGLPDDAAGQGRRERADLTAQRGGRGLAVGLDLHVGVLDDPGSLGLGLLPHLRDDRGALLTRLLADARRLVARVGDLGLELLLGRSGLGLRLVQLGELLADRVLPGRHRAVDRRDDELGQEEEQHQERGQLDEERGVRNEEVALHGSDRNACHRWVPLLASYRGGGAPGQPRTKTNSAMKARLMKNIASTRPTVRKKMVCRRPCASGWRATPSMYDEPARPSPIPAPIAPPARAMPPPTKAPASLMASEVAVASAMSLLGYAPENRCLFLKLWSRPTGSVSALVRGQRRPRARTLPSCGAPRRGTPRGSRARRGQHPPSRST